MLYFFMTQRHEQILELFCRWWQRENPDGRIYENRTGKAKAGKAWIPYGMPPPNNMKKTEKKYRGGGGADLFAFSPRGTLVMYEVKTLAHPDLAENQIFQNKIFTDIGFEVWIVKEFPGQATIDQPWELIRFEDYI